MIDALNRDQSFRDFTIEQLAGDMLKDASVAQRVATGFHRNSQLNQEGGIDVEEQRWPPRSRRRSRGPARARSSSRR